MSSDASEGYVQNEEVDQEICRTLIYFCQQDIVQKIKVKIAYALGDFANDCKSTETIVDILNLFGSESMTDPEVQRLNVISSMDLINLSLSTQVKEAALYALLKIALNGPEFRSGILDYLEK